MFLAFTPYPFFALVFAVSIGLFLIGLYSKKRPTVVYGLIALALVYFGYLIIAKKESEAPVIKPANTAR